MTHAHESDALTSLMVASAGHDSPTASSEASIIILSGMCDVKQSDVSCDGLLQPQARVCAQPQGPDRDHTKHIGQTTASNALFFYQLAVGADMSHGFFHDKVLNIHSTYRIVSYRIKYRTVQRTRTKTSERTPKPPSSRTLASAHRSETHNAST